MTSGKSPDPSEPQVPLLWAASNSHSLMTLLRGINAGKGLQRAWYTVSPQMLDVRNGVTLKLTVGPGGSDYASLGAVSGDLSHLVGRGAEAGEAAEPPGQRIYPAPNVHGARLRHPDVRSTERSQQDMDPG